MAATIFGDSPIKDLSFSGTSLTFPDLTTLDNYLASFSPPIVINFLSSPMTGGSGNFVAYGDVRDIDLTAASTPAPSTPGPFVYLTVAVGYTFNFGADSLTFANGNNELYGDMRDLSEQAIGSVSSAVSLVLTGIYGNTFNFGMDSISAGTGSNTVYGDARDITITSQGPSNPYGLIDLDFGEGAASFIELQTYAFAKDTITLGNGNNVVYGDMRDLIASAYGESGSPIGVDNFTSVAAFSQNNIMLASNVITVGNGNNVIYGNFRDWTFYGSGGTISGPIVPDLETDTNGEVSNISVTSANLNPNSTNNLIYIGKGNNTIFANGENLTITVVGGLLQGGASTLGIAGNNSFSLGNDVVQAAVSLSADGNNTVYGDLMNMTLQSMGGENDGGYIGANVQIRASTYVMGNDTITLGNGNNTVFGDMNDVNWIAHGGLNTVNNDFGLDRLISLTGNNMTMGNDTISVGNGNNTIYGDAHNINLEAFGGTADVFNSPGALTFRAIGGGNVIDFGNDMISAGKGSNVISGDAWDVNMEAVGGTASNGNYAWGRIKTVDLHFGDDTITVGKGSDTIYGDAHSFSMASIGGTVNNSGGLAEGQVTNNTVEFGNNMITAMSNNDTLYANVEYLNLLFQDGANNAGILGDALAVMTGNSITFGNSTLVGGSGNNIFYGDAQIVTGLDQFLASGNTVSWSTHNVFTGGTGHNEFHFTVFNEGGLVTEGNTEITNFGVGQNNKLVFDAPGNVTLASLDAAITKTYVGNDTVLTFHDGSHITLDNFHLAVLTASNTVIVH